MTKNYYGFLIAILYIFPMALFAQNKIEGRVTDNNNDPIPAATILVENTDIGTSTDSDGRFILENVPRTKITLITRAVGYQTHKQTINGSQHPSQLNIVLRGDNLNLDEVVVSGTMKEVSKLESPVPVEVYTARFFKSN